MGTMRRLPCCRMDQLGRGVCLNVLASVRTVDVVKIVRILVRTPKRGMEMGWDTGLGHKLVHGL